MAILGFFILIVILFPGLPGWSVSFLIGLLSFCVVVIGLIGSRYHAYQNEFFAAKKPVAKEIVREEPIEVTETTVIIEEENDNAQ